MLIQRPLRVAVLCSHRAPGIESLVEDPARGYDFDLVACVSSENELAGRERLEAAEVICIEHSIHDFHRNGGMSLRNPVARRLYDQVTVRILEALQVDLVLLSSYLYILTAPVLERWEGRIVNLHDSDLTLRDWEGDPRYAGLHSTRDAIAAGETETRVTAHLVEEAVDRGPLLLRSEPFPVATLVHDARIWRATEILKAYGWAHREWMMRAVWGPMLREVVRLYSECDVAVRGRDVVVDGVRGPLPFMRPEVPRLQEAARLSTSSSDIGGPLIAAATRDERVLVEVVR